MCTKLQVLVNIGYLQLIERCVIKESATAGTVICNMFQKDAPMRSTILILISGTLWGIMGLFVKQLTNLGFTSVEISSLRWIFAVIILFSFVVPTDRKKLRVRLNDMPKFAVSGIFGMLALSTLLYMSMSYTSIAVADVLSNTSPIWVLAASVPLFGEKLGGRKIIAVLLAFLGCAFVCGLFNGDAVRVSLPGILCGLGAGIAYASYSIVGKFILRDYDSITLTFWSSVFACLGSLFLIDLPNVAVRLIAAPTALIYVLLIAVLCTILPFFLYSLGLKSCAASKAAVLVCADPVTAALISVTAADEPFSFTLAVGIVLVISAIIFLQTNNTNKKGEKQCTISKQVSSSTAGNTTNQRTL